MLRRTRVLVASLVMTLALVAASAQEPEPESEGGGSTIHILGEEPKPPVVPPAAPLPLPDDPDQPKHAPPEGEHMQEIFVPAGKSVDDVVAPPTAITSKVEGLGQPIAEIRVDDNSRTLSNTIEYVSGLRVGQVLSGSMIEEATVRLYSTGLFKDVAITWEAPSPKNAGRGVRVVIRAKDKFPWVVAPIFSYQARNYGGGAAFAHNNLLGRGIKLLVYADYTTAEKMLLAVWIDPSIHNTPFYYRVDAILRRDTIVEYARGHLSNPRVERQTNLDTIGLGAQVGVLLARRFHIDVRLKAYYDWTRSPDCFNTTNVNGYGTSDVVASQGSCVAPSSSGWDNTITTSMGWDSRSKVNGVQKGLQLSLTWQYGPKWLGDNWDYHLLNLTGVYAFRFFKQHNLILRWGGDLDFSPPFKQEIEVGAIDYTLRGTVYRQFRGDTSAHASVEYLVPLFTVLGLSVRGIGFYDTNLTWFRRLPAQTSTGSRLVTYGRGFRDYLPDTPSGVVRQSWNNGVGVGIRMYLRGVVLPLIGFDVAYGIEPNTFRYYLAIGSVLD
ncbi:MAG: BamA/TamA family outer membrane protein [Polyangia bacterium]